MRVAMHYLTHLLRSVVRSSMGNRCLMVVTSILAVMTIVFGIISAVLLAMVCTHHARYYVFLIVTC